LAGQVEPPVGPLPYCAIDVVGGHAAVAKQPFPPLPSPYDAGRAGARPAKCEAGMEFSTMADQANAEFNLRDLNDQDLVEQVHDDLYNGLRPEVEEATRIFRERAWNAEKVLNDGLVEGMRIVGIDFRDGILFVPEVLLDRKSTRLNSSHVAISYAVFCLK